MPTNLTYLFGAGASANAIPVVNGLTNRFKIFCNHFYYYLEKTEENSLEKIRVKTLQNKLIRNIESHYTIDTYAKKLFFQNPVLHTNQDYNDLIRYLSAYFIYEQLKVDRNFEFNDFLIGKHLVYDEIDTESKDKSKILIDFDYRYDSFLASILKINEDKELVIPDNINFISWNYDFQMEKAFMNFSSLDLNNAMCSLNVYATPHETYERPINKSHLIKLNGTAGFLDKNKFDTLFDFNRDLLNKYSFELLKNILCKKEESIQNGIRFSWEDNLLSKNAINLAKNKIANSRILVIIGYSFPYFNRDVDRRIFSDVNTNHLKVYIQGPPNDSSSILKRFEGICPRVAVESFTEIDQFLIPNELS